MLHLQREAADRPFEALEVGGERRRRVAEIANVLVALVDLELLPVELLLQVPILKLQSLQVAGGCHSWTNCRSWTARRKRGGLPWVLGIRVFSSQSKSIAAHSPCMSLAQRELAV